MSFLLLFLKMTRFGGNLDGVFMFLEGTLELGSRVVEGSNLDLL